MHQYYCEFGDKTQTLCHHKSMLVLLPGMSFPHSNSLLLKIPCGLPPSVTAPSPQRLATPLTHIHFPTHPKQRTCNTHTTPHFHINRTTDPNDWNSNIPHRWPLNHPNIVCPASFSLKTQHCSRSVRLNELRPPCPNDYTTTSR